LKETKSLMFETRYNMHEKIKIL